MELSTGGVVPAATFEAAGALVAALLEADFRPRSLGLGAVALTTVELTVEMLALAPSLDP